MTSKTADMPNQFGFDADWYYTLAKEHTNDQ